MVKLSDAEVQLFAELNIDISLLPVDTIQKMYPDKVFLSPMRNRVTKWPFTVDPIIERLFLLMMNYLNDTDERFENFEDAEAYMRDVSISKSILTVTHPLVRLAEYASFTFDDTNENEIACAGGDFGLLSDQIEQTVGMISGACALLMPMHSSAVDQDATSLGLYAYWAMEGAAWSFILPQVLDKEKGASLVEKNCIPAEKEAIKILNALEAHFNLTLTSKSFP